MYYDLDDKEGDGFAHSLEKVFFLHFLHLVVLVSGHFMVFYSEYVIRS